MNLHIGRSTSARTHGLGSKQAIVAACGITLTVAALGAISAWHATRSANVDRASTATSAPIQGSVAVPISPPLQPFTYYLARSQEQASQIEAALTEQANIVAGLGGTVPEHMTVIIDSPEDEALLHQAVADSEAMAASSNGLSGLQIEDLRSTPAFAPQSMTADTSQPAQELAPETGSTPLVHEQYPLVPQPAEGLAPSTVSMPHAAGTTFYLVASQQQADMVQAEVDPGSSIVAIAGSPEDLTRIQGAAALVENAQIVDLRPTVPSTYLLVSSPEEAQLVQSAVDSGESRFAGHVAVRVAGSPDEEAELRRRIGSTGTIIDLRPLEGITSDDGS